MSDGDKLQQAAAHHRHSRNRLLRYAKWTAVAVLIVFLITRVIRFFLQ